MQSKLQEDDDLGASAEIVGRQEGKSGLSEVNL
jgi:hypothetical protein